MDSRQGPWSLEEDKMLQNLMAIFGMDWSLVSKSIPGRTIHECLLWWFSFYQSFTPEEGEIFKNLFEKHGPNWSLISKSIPGKSAISCELTWLSLQRPFTPEEDEMLEILLEKYGPNWSLISKSMPGKSAMACELRMLTRYHLSLSVILVLHESSYIHDRNLSHEVGGDSGKAPSIGDMLRGNMSSGSVHSFTRDKSAPSWNALNKRHYKK
nr:transcription factor MYB44-like [Tanacetum cinerariifolium]